MVYNAESFTVEAGTRDITVRLTQVSMLAGMVLLDGQPLFSVPLLFVPVNGAASCESALHNTAQFCVYGGPGEYLVVSQRSRGSLAAIAPLHEGSDNVVRFASASGSATVVLGDDGAWVVKAAYRYAGVSAPLASTYKGAGQPWCSLRNLAPGEYIITAREQGGSGTVITKNATVTADQNTEVRMQ